MNHLVFIKRQLYILKRQYGNPLDLYTSDYSVDLSTGIKTITQVKYHIKRAIILPVSLITEAVFNQAYMKNVGREYAYGDIIEQEIKKVIIDQKDIPKTLEITPDHHIVYDNVRFEILNVRKLEKNLGYDLDMKRMTGVPVGQIFDMNITQSIRIIQRHVWT